MTATYSRITIRYGRANLGPDTTTEQAEEYEQALAYAVSDAYPGAEVEVIGERSDLSTKVTMAPDPDENDRDAIWHLSNTIWERWSQRGVCQIKGCGRIAYANKRCEAHDRRARRGSTSKAPVRPRGRETLAALSLRVPASVHAALGNSPAAKAREILTAWAREQIPTKRRA